MDVDDDLQCPVCLELYSYPIILPCSHVLCREPCAGHLFDFNFIRCPVCRDNCYVSGGISSLPRVIALENIISRYKDNQLKGEKEKEKENQKQKPESPVHQSVEQAAKERMPENPVMCQHCDSSLKRLAKKSCLNCCSSYCGRCFRRSHPSQEPFSNHEIVEPMKDFIKKIEQSNSCSNSAKCSIHKEKFTLYCSDCSRSCCRKCKSMECHRGHDLALLEDSYSNMKVSN